eukprot:scaffold5.g728.t1
MVTTRLQEQQQHAAEGQQQQAAAEGQAGERQQPAAEAQAAEAQAAEEQQAEEQAHEQEQEQEGERTVRHTFSGPFSHVPPPQRAARPAPAADAAADGPSPASSDEAAAAAKAKGPLKSALKGRAGSGSADGAGSGGGAEPVAEHATPAPPATVRKTVRIQSASNIVHMYEQADSDEEGAGGGGEGEGDEGLSEEERRARKLSSNTVKRLPKYALQDSRRLLRYQQFLHRSMSPGDLALSPSEMQAIEEATGARPGSLATRLARAGDGRRGLGGAVRALLSDGPASPLAAILLWMLSSSALIFVNARFMVDHGFGYPFALTAIGQLSSAGLAWGAGRAGLAALGPPGRLPLPRLLAVAASTALSLFLGNYAYLGLSVAFINVLKALTPMVTIGVGAALGQRKPSGAVLFAIALIGVGTAMATTQEAGSSHFSWGAFVAFILSMVCEALRVVLVEGVLGGRTYNPMEALVYIGPPTFAFLAAGSYLFEWRHDLSTQVAGCLKNVGVVMFGVMIWGDSLTSRDLSLLGFFVYTIIAPSQAAQQRRQQSVRRAGSSVASVRATRPPPPVRAPPPEPASPPGPPSDEPSPVSSPVAAKSPLAADSFLIARRRSSAAVS